MAVNAFLGGGMGVYILCCTSSSMSVSSDEAYWVTKSLALVPGRSRAAITAAAVIVVSSHAGGAPRTSP